jgi:hypothetical protein
MTRKWAASALNLKKKPVRKEKSTLSQGAAPYTQGFSEMAALQMRITVFSEPKY